jgi:hypothetical protein
VLALRQLYASEHQVTNLECPTSNIPVVVSAEGLLVLGGSEEHHVACIVELVDRVLARLLTVHKCHI